MVGVNEVKLDVSLHHFRHQAVKSASARRKGMHDDRAIELPFERIFGCIELTADASDAIDELGLVSDRMSH